MAAWPPRIIGRPVPGGSLHDVSRPCEASSDPSDLPSLRFRVLKARRGFPCRAFSPFGLRFCALRAGCSDFPIGEIVCDSKLSIPRRDDRRQPVRAFFRPWEALLRVWAASTPKNRFARRWATLRGSWSPVLDPLAAQLSEGDPGQAKGTDLGKRTERERSAAWVPGTRPTYPPASALSRPEGLGPDPWICGRLLFDCRLFGLAW